MKTINSIILFSITVFNILSYNVELIEGIRGGVDVPDGKFTYQAIVLINGVYACGAAVMNSGTLLSAGQCVLDEQGQFLDVTFEVIVGVTSFHPNDTDGKIKVDYIYVKSTFRPRGSSSSGPSLPSTLEKGDFAVLKLGVEIPDQPNVNALEFPKHHHYIYSRFTSKILNVSGFGINTGTHYQSSSDLSNIAFRLNIFGQLTYAQAQVLNEKVCSNHYRDIRDDHICAKTIRPDAPTGPCLGDAGDPLVFDNFIVGVMQYYTENCDSRLRPAVYARVTSSIGFITNAMENSFQSDMRLGNYTGPHVIEVQRVARN